VLAGHALHDDFSVFVDEHMRLGSGRVYTTRHELDELVGLRQSVLDGLREHIF
jgi:hypothetical protein